MGIRYNGKTGAKSVGRGNSNHAAADFNGFKKLKEQNLKHKRQIKSVKRSYNIEDNTDNEELDSGDQF